MTKTSALFVDFDNVYISLLHESKAAAKRFAERPSDWLEWFISGAHDVAVSETGA